MVHRQKNPETFHNTRFLAVDFDGTVARTFEPSPNNIDVHSAHRIAVKKRFGQEGLARYIADGGLGNRAPSEVVRSLVPHAPVDELAEMTERFIDDKLDVLLNEITCRWPRPVAGYFETRDAMKTSGDFDEAIISSGHVPFIVKTYETWGEEPPEYIVAEETIRNLASVMNITPPVKPHPALMEVAHQLWRASYGEHQPDSETSRTLYVGDDPVKDGELARNSGVDFVLVDPEKPRESWREVRQKLYIAGESDECQVTGM